MIPCFVGVVDSGDACLLGVVDISQEFLTSVTRVTQSQPRSVSLTGVTNKGLEYLRVVKKFNMATTQ